MLALLMPVAAPAQLPHPRWELTIRGPDIGEVGDLRFDGRSGRVLLQRDDGAFQSLKDLHVGDGRISFLLAGHSPRTFTGTVSDSLLTGTVHDALGNIASWDAVPLSAERGAWPIAPRVVVRQLAMGSSATSERMPAAWIAAGPDSAALEREYRELAILAQMPIVAGPDRGARANLMALGLDSAARYAARGVLNRIAHGAAADPEFFAVFTRDPRDRLAPHGPLLKIDIHDALLWEAPHYQWQFQLMRAADALRMLRELDATTTDSSTIRQAAWRFWSSVAADSAAAFRRLDSLSHRDEGAANTLRAMLAGFDDASAWWRRAVSWLLTHRWLDTPEGPRSPAQLMARFWGVDSLPLPEIAAARFGGAAAMPVISVQHVAPWLFSPGNASAAEWLPHGVSEAFAIWRPLRWGETPLTVVIGGRAATIASPASQAIVHPASFFGERDAIRIDPGMMPLAAVAAYLHEWNHLLASQRRLAGAHPVAVITSPWQLQVREDDPWLAEGFAEWATDEVLRPAGESAGFLRFTQAEKRVGIADADPNDPHVLGFRLVRGVARTRRVPVLRDALVQNLHDLAGFARAAGLPPKSTGAAIMLQRPATAIVIPEITFTWVEGTAFDLSRRLIIPNSRPEH